jgi:hypothetical protein
MDGFNAIPIQQNSGFQSQPQAKNPTNSSVSVPTDASSIEIIDDSQPKPKSEESSLFLMLSIVVLLGVFGYFGYLVFSRILMLQQITQIGADFEALSTTINKDEIEEFITLDESVKAINSRLDKHILVSNVLSFVNRNIRNNMQVSDYRVSTNGKDVEVVLVNISPSFKELAEQTEKMFELRNQGEIKSFSVSQLSLENDGRKVRFNLNILFDKTKMSATFNKPIVNNSGASEPVNNFNTPANPGGANVENQN